MKHIHHFLRGTDFMVMSPQKNYVTQASASGVKLYSFPECKQLYRFATPKNPGSISFSSDEKYIAIKDTQQKLMVYDLNTFELIYRFSKYAKINDSDYDVLFLEDSSTLFEYGCRTLLIHDLINGISKEKTYPNDWITVFLNDSGNINYYRKVIEFYNYSECEYKKEREIGTIDIKNLDLIENRIIETELDYETIITLNSKTFLVAGAYRLMGYKPSCNHPWPNLERFFEEYKLMDWEERSGFVFTSISDDCEYVIETSIWVSYLSSSPKGRYLRFSFKSPVTRKNRIIVWDMWEDKLLK